MLGHAANYGRRLGRGRPDWPLAVPRAPPTQISTCVPSSISRLPGIWKNAVAGKALRDMKANSLSRHSAMPGRRLSATMFSRERKNVVSIRSKGRPLRAHLRQRQRNVRILGETEAQFQADRIRRPSRVMLDALVGLGHRRLQHIHRQHHVALVQHLVVLEVVQQRMRHGILVGGKEHRRARHTQRRMLENVLDERQPAPGHPA